MKMAVEEIDALIQRMADFHFEPVNGNYVTCLKNSREIAEEIARNQCLNTEFNHRYSTIVYEIWSDGWQQGYKAALAEPNHQQKKDSKYE